MNKIIMIMHMFKCVFLLFNSLHFKKKNPKITQNATYFPQFKPVAFSQNSWKRPWIVIFQEGPDPLPTPPPPHPGSSVVSVWSH